MSSVWLLFAGPWRLRNPFQVSIRHLTHCEEESVPLYYYSVGPWRTISSETFHRLACFFTSTSPLPQCALLPFPRDYIWIRCAWGCQYSHLLRIRSHLADTFEKEELRETIPIITPMQNRQITPLPVRGRRIGQQKYTIQGPVMFRLAARLISLYAATRWSADAFPPGASSYSLPSFLYFCHFSSVRVSVHSASLAEKRNAHQKHPVKVQMPINLSVVMDVSYAMACSSYT